MSRWSLLLCEGAHDHEFLCALARASKKWTYSTARPPEGVPATFSRSEGSGPNLARYGYLTCDIGSLVVASVGGDSKILGDPGRLLVEYSDSVHSIGVIIDADEFAVDVRAGQCKDFFGKLLPSARLTQVGQVVRDEGQRDARGFGLWIAPDCAEAGNLDSLIRLAAEQVVPRQLRLADEFADKLEEVEPGCFGRDREKAVLCSCGQPIKPGQSLAAVLQSHDRWLNSKVVDQGAFAGILRFMWALLE